MALRNGHGTGKGSPRIEVLPIDELPDGAPVFYGERSSPEAERLRGAIAASREALEALERDGGGRLSPEGTRLLGRIGGLEKALRHERGRLAAEQRDELAELAADLLPEMLVTDEEFKKGLPLALEFIRVETATLARDVGGGQLAAGPASMLVSAALQLLASRVLFARGDFRSGSALANDSRQNLAACHEYAARRGVARAAGGSDPNTSATPERAAELVRLHFGGHGLPSGTRLLGPAPESVIDLPDDPQPEPEPPAPEPQRDPEPEPQPSPMPAPVSSEPRRPRYARLSHPADLGRDGEPQPSDASAEIAAEALRRRAARAAARAEEAAALEAALRGEGRFENLGYDPQTPHLCPKPKQTLPEITWRGTGHRR